MNLKKISMFLMASILISCASVEKVSLNTDKPEDAITEVETLKTQLRMNHSDLLAPESFDKADEYLSEAKNDLENSEDDKEILNNLTMSKTFFMKAKSISTNKSYTPKEMLEARHEAVMAGASSVIALRKKLNEIDDDLQDSTSDFTKKTDAKTFSSLQKRYLNLQVEAIQDQELSDFRKIINKAKDQNAEDLATQTLREAQTDLIIAENLIAQNPKNKKSYYDSVEKSNRSAKLLKDVMTKLTGEARGSSEKVALKLVSQERRVGKLNNRVKSLRGDLTWVAGELVYTEGELEKEKEVSTQAQRKVAFQKAIESARKSFDESEVMAYQQGDKLIFRLKKINFKTNSAKVPASADPVISKISTIIEDLYPAKVTVQGHTDATREKDYNKALSKKRATSVKDLMSSLNKGVAIDARGYGEDMPIANNQTSQGRSENRRVDIVVDVK